MTKQFAVIGLVFLGIAIFVDSAAFGRSPSHSVVSSPSVSKEASEKPSELDKEVAQSFEALSIGGKQSDVEQMRKLLSYPPYVKWINAKIKEAASKVSDESTRKRFEQMTIRELFAFWNETVPLTATELAQSLAVLETGAGSALGERRPLVCKLTTEYANSNGQGHAGWEGRFQRLWNAYSTYEHPLRRPGQNPHPAENEASTRHSGDNLMVQARECMRMYRHSEGHWEAMQRYSPIACHDMKPVHGYKCVSEFLGWSNPSPRWR